ncbi:unnamed protein product [Phytophthora fragariaefolia]|uniref:Unnamed protein product n=1 Tax=Phytophthora fragariaefolia TaxID=1490495 RepID=A0A9W7DAV2_9STRA|nr:unnamed protein product [Phytophthora fragariaefolia]
MQTLRNLTPPRELDIKSREENSNIIAELINFGGSLVARHQKFRTRKSHQLSSCWGSYTTWMGRGRIVAELASSSFIIETALKSLVYRLVLTVSIPAKVVAAEVIDL